LIDIGVNLTNKRFDKDRLEVLARAEHANISAMLVTGTNVEESQQAAKMCQQHPDQLFCTAGVHPHDADHVSANYLTHLRELAQLGCVKAIGECGLDFNRNFSSPEQQKLVFAQQVQLAKELKLPLFLHQRDAFTSWFDILKPYVTEVPAMVAHCFTGNERELKQCLDQGMYIGITGWVCDERRGQELRDIVKYIPLEKLMIETDAPYLIPRTIRPKPKSSRNEPSYLGYVAATLASLLDCSEQELIHQTSVNAKRVFDLSNINA
jgi:TatD DNase family protein